MSSDGFFTRSEVTARAPLPRLPQCDRCGLHQAGCNTPMMPVSGAGRLGILVCSDYPGKNEDREGVQFVGESGKYLGEVLARSGVDMRRDCWLTNARICYSASDPPEHAVDDCRPNLLRTVRELNPEVVILAGGDAVRSLLTYTWGRDPGGVRRWAGYRIPDRRLNAWVCPTYNPAYVVRRERDRDRDPVLERDFSSHVAAAVRSGGRPYPSPPPDLGDSVDVVLDPDAAADRVRRVRSGLIAFDFETDRLKPDAADAQIICCSYCWNGTETVAFPWAGAVRRAMVELLEDPNVGKIGQNIKFETRFCLARLGCMVQNWVFDTMLAAHALDPRPGVTGLEFQEYTRLGLSSHKYLIAPFLESTQPGGNSPNRIRQVEIHKLLKYNALDSLTEYLISQILAKEIGVEL